MSAAVSDTVNDHKKIQIRNSFFTEMDKAFKLLESIEESVELQSVYNIFTILQTSNPDLIMNPFHEDFTKKFNTKIIPVIDIDFFLTYDIESHIRVAVTTEYISKAMVAFCKKTQSTLNNIHNKGTEHEKAVVAQLGTNLQKLVKLSNLYNK